MLHAKAILIDNRLAITGSANMDMRSLLLNYEVALCIYDKPLIKQLETWMVALRKDSSMQQIQDSGSFELLKGMGRLLAPLL
jgi:cardiolipin synthase